MLARRENFESSIAIGKFIEREKGKRERERERKKNAI